MFNHVFEYRHLDNVVMMIVDMKNEWGNGEIALSLLVGDAFVPLGFISYLVSSAGI